MSYVLFNGDKIEVLSTVKVITEEPINLYLP